MNPFLQAELQILQPLIIPALVAAASYMGVWFRNHVKNKQVMQFAQTAVKAAEQKISADATDANARKKSFAMSFLMSNAKMSYNDADALIEATLLDLKPALAVLPKTLTISATPIAAPVTAPDVA
jgi:hypothetical protein